MTAAMDRTTISVRENAPVEPEAIELSSEDAFDRELLERVFER